MDVGATSIGPDWTAFGLGRELNLETAALVAELRERLEDSERRSSLRRSRKWRPHRRGARGDAGDVSSDGPGSDGDGVGASCGSL